MTEDIEILPEIAIPAAREPEPTHCDCGAAWRFDPTLEGETCGGVHRVGWLVCEGCGATRVTRRGHEAGPFKLAKSGRSMDAGGFRVQAEGGGDPSALMARLVRLPDLEAALRRIVRESDDQAAVDIARDALMEVSHG